MRTKRKSKSTIQLNPQYAKGYELLRNPFALSDARNQATTLDNLNALLLIYDLSARQRREEELADEKRRNERKEKEDKLDKRLADTLENSEYRLKPFGGEGYDEHKKELETNIAQSVPSVESPKDPEPPEYLKIPEKQSFWDVMMKNRPSFTPTGKTTVADSEKQEEYSTYDIYNPSTMEKTRLNLDIASTMLDGVETAYSVADYDLQEAQLNVLSAIQENNLDPSHGNFWGGLMTEILDWASTPNGTPSMAAVGTYGPNIGSTLEKKTWAKNAVGYGAIQKNKIEVSSDVGEINKYKEMLRRGADIKQYTANIQRSIRLSDLLDLLKQLPATQQNAQLIKEVQSELQRLDIENKQLYKLAQDASSYIYENGEYDKYAAITSYNASIGAPRSQSKAYTIDALNNIVTTNGYSGLTQEQKNLIASYTNALDKKIDGILKEFDTKRPELLNRMADNIREMKSWMNSNYNPSEEFVKKAEAVTEFNFTDPNTYAYGMPGLIGSSMSFGGYQLASTALGLTAAVGGTIASGGTAAVLAAAASAGSLGMGIAGGHYENDAEVADNYQQVFIKKLTKDGLYEQWLKEGREAIGKKDASDDEIMYAMAAGIYEPKEKIKDVAEISTYGLNNLYKNDMQAVVGSEIFEAGLNYLGPILKIAKASAITPGAKATRFARMRKLLEQHPTLAKVYQGTYNIGKDMMDSELGGAIAASVSYPLVLAGKAIGAGMKAAVPKSAVRLLNKKLGFAADLMEKMPVGMLGAKAIGKNLWDFSSKVIGAGWSEAIEEGKQYLNGKKFADGSYSGASDTFMDSIINDIAGGSRAAYSFVGDMFGISSDKELIANMKGGFLGGFGHTATILGFNAVSNMHHDMSVNNFVINNVMANKIADRTAIANNSYLAQQTSPQQYERVMNAFDAMELIATQAEERNKGTEGLNITAEDVRNQRKAYQEVFDAANSKNVQQAARNLEIQPGTEKFGNFVGLVMWAKDLASQGVKNTRDIEKRANSLVNGFISGNLNEESGLKDILQGMSYIDLLKLNEEFGLMEETQSTGPGLGSEVWNAMLVRSMIPSFVNYIKEIASLDALFTLRDQLEMMAQPTPADKRRLRSVNRQISKLKSMSQFKSIKDASTADDFLRIPNQQLHDALRDLYRDSANFTVDIEEGTALQYALLGGNVAGLDFLSSPEMQEAYKNAQGDIKDRKKTALNLIDRYLRSVKSDEELKQLIHDTFENTLSEEEQFAVEDMDTETPVAQPEVANINIPSTDEGLAVSSEEGSVDLLSGLQEKPAEPVSEPSEPTSVTLPTTVPEQQETPLETPENTPVAIPETTAPAQSTTQPQTEAQPEVKPELEEEDYDAIIDQIEAEYAPSSNTMFTDSDIDTDFGISKEDWSKVSAQVNQMIDALFERYTRFINKWHGKPLSKAQYNGVHSWVVKFQKEFNELREKALADIAREDEKLARQESERHQPTDDEIWDSLNYFEALEKSMRSAFQQAVDNLYMMWNRMIGAKNTANVRNFSEARMRVASIIDEAAENGIDLNAENNETLNRLNEDIIEYENIYQLAPPTTPVPPTPSNVTTRFEKPWAQYTTTHTGLESSAGYRVEDSVAMDGSGIKFLDVSANPDFIENGIFWFTTRLVPGKAPKIQLNVMYQGHQFTPIDIHTSDDTSGKGRRFYNNVINMLHGANGRFVMPSKSAISRTNGIIDNGPLLSLEQLGLLNNNNLYTIEYSSSQDQFCIVKYKKGPNGENIPVAYIPGLTEGRSLHEVYEYSLARPSSTMPADGGIVMMVHPPYPEVGELIRVPINMRYMPCTEGDAQLIVDLLAGKYMDDNSDYGSHAMENKMFYEDGVYKGLTRALVLKLLIRYKAQGEAYSPYEQTLRYIEYDALDQRYVILHGNFGDGVEIPNGGKFNILDENDQKTLKEFLIAHHNKTFTYNEFLRCRINRSNSDFRHPLNGLTEFRNSATGQEIFKNGGHLTFGNSSIIFDEKDFGDAAHPDGVSGLAWGMRRGFILSSFEGFSNTLLNFNEDVPLQYYDQQNQQVLTQGSQKVASPKQPETPAAPQPKPMSTILDDVITPDGFDSNLEDMDLMTGQKAKDKFDIEQANEFLRKVLGEEITEENIVENLQEIARTNASVLGLCHFSGKLLFDPYAQVGTTYHEAFHKVVELMLGDRTRKMLYKAYAKKMHIKYKNDEDLLKNKQVREGLAEEFRYYMENRPTVSLGSLKHPFKLLKQFSQLMSKIGDYRLYMFYAMTRAGATKHLYKMSPEKVLRFLQSHGAFAPFSIGGHDFEHILNRYLYRVLRKTLTYLIFRTNNIGLLGDGIENFRISKQAILRDKNYLIMINSKASGAAALKELVENLEYVEADIKNYIYNTFELNRNDDDEVENEQDIEGGEGAMEASFNQLKYSHESSQFSRAGAKVKFALARIPKKRFGYKQGKRVEKNVLNDEGLVEYFDVKTVFNTLVNHCHDCRNAKELLSRLEKLGKDNFMFKYIHDNILQQLYDNALKGDADAEAAFSQILVSLHASKGEYVIGKANRDADGTWNVTIQSTDSDYNAREYKTVWSQLFCNGSEYLEKSTSGYQMKFRKGTDRRYSPEVFRNIYTFFNDVKKAVLSGGEVVVRYIDADNKVQARTLNVTKEEDFDYVKDEFCNTLLKLGIQFSKDELNYTLRIQYGSSDAQALSRMFERTDTTNITPFLDWLNGCYNPVTKTLNITPNGTLNGRNIETAIGEFGFIGMLADAKYKYTHDHDQLSVLATKGNRYYVISENNLITDITDDINAVHNGDNKMMNELKSFSYNFIPRGNSGIGSLIIKLVQDGAKLKVVTVAGFRTDQKGDLGQDYAEISPAEDYITKCQIIMQGGLIFPTMSDKKTWTYLDGINIPGLSFIGQFTNLGNGAYSMTQDRNVLKQLLDYAKCELQAIIECMRAIRGYKDDEGNWHEPLKESEKVLNYHKNEPGKGYKGHTIIQGGRFGVLTGIYDDDGKWVSFNRIHEENSDKYVDEAANWRTARNFFFGFPDPEKPGMYYVRTKKGNGSAFLHLNELLLQERQMKLLERSLNKQVENELKYAADLGLIEQVSTDESVPPVLRYKNKMIDSKQIKALAQHFTGISEQEAESLALATYMSRISAASNISLQEVERLYAGHPAFFKWNYGKNGEIIDRSVDQHKRLGGLISTGLNNVLDIPGLPMKYVCAEVDNDMVGSKLSEELKLTMMDGELRSAYMRTQLEKAGVTLSNSNSEEAKNLAAEIEAMSLDEIKEKLEKNNPDIYKMLVNNATKKANDFVEGIDVADGAAYVTDEMAEWLLRMVGSWDSKIEKAFKILRGEEVDGKVYTTKDILTLQQAYKDVLTTVIGNLKYTAYGFRFAGGIAAPYYDKMALFPMFKCLSTGATAKVFDKMKKEGVHMLMINSAVKVGSQGSKPMVMSDFREDNDPSNEANFNGELEQQDWKPSFEDSFHFNTYEQEFKYIRKQFNTDPKGDVEIKMGTQMTKVAMASIMPGRDYLVVEGIDENGNKIYKTASAVDVRNDIMNCINLMSNLGEKKVRERFIKETTVLNEDGSTSVNKEVKIEELSKFLKEELASRGASQEAIDAVSITLNTEGEKVMRIPPVAQNSLEWIQSIITSMINKNVVDINTPGAAFIQRSVWDMEGPTTVQNVEDLPGTIYEGRELQMINEEGTMDCVLSIDFYKDIIPEDIVKDSEGHIVYEKDDDGNYLYTTTTDENGSEIRKRIPMKQKKSFEAARQWLIDNNIISGRKSNGEWSDATAAIVGSRIPTQAQSSIHALRCVDVLPVVRDTIVLPKEFTKITGADFDIDKLFLSRFYFNNKGGKVSTQFKEGTHEYYANRLLSNYIALLKDTGSKENEHTNRTSHSNHASIDGDTKLLKDIVKDLEEHNEEKTLDPYTPYSLWANAATKTEFITGKFGIGPFALNNNSLILTMLYGVKFKKDGFLGFLGMNRLDLSQDRYGNSILSWLSGLINAHVDVAKDPYISRLNVNKYTYNLVNLMIRTGFGKDAFYFTTQPIMKEMAKAYNNAASQYGSESSKGKSRRQKEAVDKVVFDFVKKNFKLPTNVGSLKQANKVLDGYFEKVRKISVDNAITELLSKDNDILHQISKNQIPMNGRSRMYMVGGQALTAYEIQYLVYRAKNKFEPYEESLSNLVRYSKIDTKKQGKNVTEQMDYKVGVDELFNRPNNDYGLFEDLSDYYEHSYIKDKTKNALDLFSDIMGSFTIESTPQFQILMNKVLEEIGETKPSADTRKAVARQIMNYIRAGFFNKWAIENEIDIKGLVSGDRTISDRLEEIRIKVMTDPAYADMRAVDGSIKNYLLASLVQGFQYKEDNRTNLLNIGTQPATHNNAKFVKTLNFMDSDHVNDDDMSEAWDELLNDGTHPDLQEFARDLIMYSFITSGGNSGSNLFKFIPNSWKLDSYGTGVSDNSYALYMQDMLYEYQTATEELPIDVQEIVMNNWFDDKFIPTVSTDEDWIGYYTGLYYQTANSKADMTIPILLIKKYADPDVAGDDKYIKVKRNATDKHTPRNYTIYKAIAYTSNGELIYAMVDPKGNKFPRDVIYEMRRNDAEFDESISIAGHSPQFAETLHILKEAMGIKDSSISGILEDFINKLRNSGEIGTSIAMIDAATQEPVLKKLFKDAAMIHEVEDAWSNTKENVVDDDRMLSRDIVEKDTKTLYIFTDNTDRDSGSGVISDDSWYALKYGTGHHFPTKTLAVIRGLDNARPISTQRWYHDGAKGESGRWNDSDFDEFKSVIDDEIQEIKNAWSSGKFNRVVFPGGINGFFNTRISNISEDRTPILFQYLRELLLDLRHFIDNGTATTRQEAEETGARTYEPSALNKVTEKNVSNKDSEQQARLKFLEDFLDVLDRFGELGGETHMVPYKEFAPFNKRSDDGGEKTITTYFYRAYGVDDLSGICEYNKETKEMEMNDWCYSVYKLFKYDNRLCHQWFDYLFDNFSDDLYGDIENLKSTIIDEINDINKHSEDKKLHHFDVVSAIKKYLFEYATLPQNPEFTDKTNVKSQKETTTVAALEYIKQNGSSEFYKNAAEVLLKFAKIHPASVLFTPNVDYGASGHASFDPHNPKDAFVELFTSNRLYKVAPEGAILHEISHNVSQFIVRIIEDNADTPISKYMEYIQDYILNETAKNGALNTTGDYGALAMEMIYGFKSPSEFVAEFMSNPMFCDILKQIPAMEKNKFDNIFDEVIHWICKVISNLFKDNSNSVYEQIKPIIEGLMEIQSKLDYSNTEWASQLSELLDDELRFLTKSEVDRLRRKIKAYEILNKAKYVRKQSSGYFIQKGQLTIRKDGVARYDAHNESLPMRYEKIQNLLKNAGMNPESILNGYNKFTGEIYFKSVYDEDNIFDKYNQYKLDGPDAFSELMRMQNDDKELFDEYWKEMRNSLGC